jgi:ribokinase
MKKNNSDVVCIGGITQDIFFYSDQLRELDNPKNQPDCQKLLAVELNAKICGKNLVRTWGGGAGNSAVNFNLLGLSTAVISSVGNDASGAAAINHFNKKRINCRFIKIVKNQETALSFLLSNALSGNQAIFTYDGAKNNLNFNLSDLKLLKPKWIYLTSLAGNWPSLVKKIISYKKSSNCRLAWNPGAWQLSKGSVGLKPYIKYCDVLLLNRDEAVGLLAEENNLPINELLEKLRSLGASISVVTDGPAGVYAVINQQRYFEPALTNLKPINITGAGDAFNSTFIAALIKGLPLSLAMRCGIRQSSNVIKYVGAQTGLQTWSKISAVK